MSRLTKRILPEYGMHYAANGEVSVCQFNNKLGQLEDIEELCEKMVSQSIYEIYYGASEIHEENYIGCQALYNFKEKRIELVDCFEIVNWFNVDDYGKTFALTKEELENGYNEDKK